MATGNAISIQVDSREVDKRLSAMPDRIERACLRKALRAVANKLKRRLKAGTPHLTGAAQRAVKVKVRVRRRMAYAVVDYKRSAYYIRMYDQGTSRQRARPFFAATIRGFEQDAKTEFVTALKSAVETAEAVA